MKQSYIWFDWESDDDFIDWIEFDCDRDIETVSYQRYFDRLFCPLFGIPDDTGLTALVIIIQKQAKQIRRLLRGRPLFRLFCRPKCNQPQATGGVQCFRL